MSTEPAIVRPKTRGDCVKGPRPCPWVSCRHHLLLEVHRGGRVKLNHRVDDIEQLADTCALDIADRPPTKHAAGRGCEGATLEVVGAALGLTRERIRQIEAKALAKARRAGLRLGAYEVLDGDEGIAHRLAPEIAELRAHHRVLTTRAPAPVRKETRNVTKRKDILTWMAEVGTAVTATDIAGRFGISQKSAFGHLGYLMKAGDIQRPERGKYVLTAVSDVPIADATPEASVATIAESLTRADVVALRRQLSSAQEATAKLEAELTQAREELEAVTGERDRSRDRRTRLARVVRRIAGGLGHVGHVGSEVMDADLALAEWTMSEVGRLQVHAEQLEAPEDLPDGLVGWLMQSHNAAEKLIPELQAERDGYIDKLGETIKRLQRSEEDCAGLRAELRARIAREEFLRGEIARLAGDAARAELRYQMERRTELRVELDEVA